LKKIFAFILTFTICFGCTEKKSEINASIFFGTDPKNEKFNLTFNKTEKSLNYKYINQIDTTKTISIRKIINSDSLRFGYQKFLKTDRKSFRNEKLNDLEFEFYEMVKPVTDGTGPILFNSHYGLLAIKNGLGPTIIFLDNKDITLAQQIIDNLNE